MRLDDDLKYFETPEFKEILTTYETAKDAGTQLYMDADELTDVAEYYSMVKQDEAAADEVIDFALQLHPDAVDPQIFKARQFMLQGDTEHALQVCDAIEDQQHREVFFLRAELLVRNEKLEDAATLLQDARQQMDEDMDYFLYDSAYIFIDYRQFEWALLFANDLEEMAPDWYKTWQLQADVQLGLENYAVALRYIERMLDVDPFSTESWNWRAEAYCGDNEYSEAMNSIEYALAIEPENERAMQLKAWVLLQQGNTADAHQLYLKEIEKAPDNEQNWLYDSYCLLDTEELDDALAAIEKAEALADGVSPDQITIYEQHAQILSRRGEVEAAISYLDKAEWESVSDTEPADFDLLRARVFAENQRPADAVEMIERAYTKVDEEQQEDIYYRAGLLLFDTGYYEAAKNIFGEFLNHHTDPKEQAVDHAYLAYCAMMLKNDDDALQHIRQAQDAPEQLRELFEDEFPNVEPADYYDYYYYRTYGHWPQD